MIRSTHNRTSLLSICRRLTVGAVVVGGMLGVTAIGNADAAPRSKSEVVATEAVRALDSLASWRATQNPADYVRFVQARELAAAITAQELEIDADQLRDEWAATSDDKQEAVLSALTQLGVPYRTYKSKAGVGFDCSGLTIWAFDQAGLEIPRSSRDQFRAAVEIDHDEAEAGDLVYYPGHIAIYLGADIMVHSPNSGSHVEAAHIPTKRSLRFADLADPAAKAQAEAAATSAAERSGTALVDGATSVTQ
jgi:cell wall-associated NlpC family hydrolase